jgi:DNA-binding SARP family transcriptional activator
MDGFNTFEKQDKVLLGLNSGSDAAAAMRILQQQGFAVQTFTAEHEVTPAGLLQLLADNRNGFVSRKEIVEKIWNETDPKSKEASLNNILSHLRKYLSRDPHIGLESKINTGVKLSIDQ